ITSFSARPMRWIFLTGLVLLAVALIVTVYVLISYFFSDHIEAGWASLMLSVWILGSMILIAIGIVGEYIGKIFNEVKHRPRYAIRDTLWD
ncbi:MAG: glycosyltransferase, partial [Muribaculaceae bacterium]|nr:glycosyltransferase [Muribaculaceae bacterium]